MSDFTDLLKFLHGAGASVIPWILVVLAIWLIIYIRPHLAAYLKSLSDAKIMQAKHDGERNEIIRNCSATIEACTAVLEMAKADRQTVIEHIDIHEEMSAERMNHIQAVVNQCRDEILKTRGDLSAINARLDKR